MLRSTTIFQEIDLRSGFRLKTFHSIDSTTWESKGYETASRCRHFVWYECKAIRFNTDEVAASRGRSPQLAAVENEAASTTDPVRCICGKWAQWETPDA